MAIPKIFKIDVDHITVPKGRRPIDPAMVITMAGSMKQMGLKTPITIRRLPEDDYTMELVAGGHRLAAALSLDWQYIDCFIMEGSADDAEIWEIGENLHRNELTMLERGEQTNRYRELSLKRVQLGPFPGSRHPAEAGIKKTARELNISKQEVQRAMKIASLTPEAKQAAKERGLDNDQQALLEAAEFHPNTQVEAIHRTADFKANRIAAMEPKTKATFIGGRDEHEEEQMARLVAAWNLASPSVRQRFLKERMN